MSVKKTVSVKKKTPTIYSAKKKQKKKTGPKISVPTKKKKKKKGVSKITLKEIRDRFIFEVL